MPCGWQMLSLTADNASANDTMTRQLAKLIPSFGGEPTRTRCFLHIVNLVAKSILKEFDSSKNKADLDEDLLATAGDDLAEGLEGEEQITLAERGDEDDMEDDDVEGWVDEMEEMSIDERNILKQSMRPVRITLVKVMFTHQ
jgi:hypothetical protein